LLPAVEVVAEPELAALALADQDQDQEQPLSCLTYLPFPVPRLLSVLVVPAVQGEDLTMAQQVELHRGQTERIPFKPLAVQVVDMVHGLPLIQQTLQGEI
jgi:hypothetical protein